MFIMSDGTSTITGPPRPLRSMVKARRMTFATSPGATSGSTDLVTCWKFSVELKLGFT
ncbi:hypothetical protein D3C83_332570 [compost metagenome]